MTANKQRTLGQINGLPPGQPLKFHHTPQQKHNKGIDHRVRKNCSRYCSSCHLSWFGEDYIEGKKQNKINF